MGEEGQKVKMGDKLMDFDLKYIQSNAKSAAIPMVFTNLNEGSVLEVAALGDVTKDTTILYLK